MLCLQLGFNASQFYWFHWLNSFDWLKEKIGFSYALKIKYKRITPHTSEIQIKFNQLNSLK